MVDIAAVDVKALRDATGAGMMDAKRALTEAGGDFDAASVWLRERGLGKAAERSGRDNSDGAIAIAASDDGKRAAVAELKCESDFVAKSPQFVELAGRIAGEVLEDGEGAVERLKDAVDDLRVTLKENIEVGRVARLAGDSDTSVGTYLHVQNGRGVNGVIVELSGGTLELAHDIAVHVAFGRPGYLHRDDVAGEAIETERKILEAEAEKQGVPEKRISITVDKRLEKWFKRTPGGVLLDQPYVRNEKKSVGATLGSASITRFEQVSIGG